MFGADFLSLVGPAAVKALFATALTYEVLHWSLVLVSQGIESTIEPAVESQGWRLVVARNDCQRAIQAIRRNTLTNTETFRLARRF